ncbi:MAG TPA: methylmalonyl-CoA mutase subunit beta [Geminicoccaceae bacterium]|nr:methylmalonyl-CoA mutase subunit beta [Geminicoccus sp.]HMU52185.1 methylmalonyl-CoA mutase subunit beta [Geminicoccaceae bacterium]
MLTSQGGFPPATRAQWQGLVDKVLKGADPKRLVRRTYDRIDIRPLYDVDPQAGAGIGLPGRLPFVRGATAAGNLAGWDVRQRHAHPDPATNNARILEDLRAGVTSILLRLDSALATRGEAPDGCCVYDIEDMDRVLAGVDLRAAPVMLEGGRFGLNAALTVALCRRRGIPLDEVELSLGVDPLGIAARGIGIDTDFALARAADIVVYAEANLPRSTALLSDGHVYHAGGASEAQELAMAMATAVDYLRAAERKGLPPQRTIRQIAFRFAADADLFLTAAKLRAARKLWALIAAACGGSAEGMKLSAFTGTRMLARRDPWNNILRTTLACIGAALGGADSITVLPLDYALGQPDVPSRRIARNVHLVAMEESGLHRVIDPAGGAPFVEELTRRLAHEAWSLFQAIEGGGGMNQMLMRGTPQDWIGTTFAERMADIARRKETIVGVSEFPDLSEKPRRLEEIDVGPLEAHAKALLGDARDTRGIPFAELVERSLDGEAFIYRGRLASFTALPPRRLGEAFEDLRDRADARLAATGQPPKIFLACLGTAAEHGARLGFARGLFAAGGIEGIEGRGDPAEVAAAWRASGAVLAAVCASDEALEQSGAAAVSALVGAGCERIWVMGRPPEASPGLVEAGAAACVRAGDDILAILEDAYAYLDENP